MKRTLVLAAEAREQSKRVKNKMIKPFGNTTLFDIYLQKLEYIKKIKNPFSSVVIGLNPKDTILWDKAKSTSLTVLERDDLSTGDATLPGDVYRFVGNCKGTHFMHVNACFALLKPETIIKAANFFLGNENFNSMAPVKIRHSWFWDIEKKKPFTISGRDDGSTELCKPIYESVHCFYIHKIDDVVNKNIWWELKKNDPHLYLMEDSSEFLDIDYPFEFEIAEAVWKQKYERK